LIAKLFNTVATLALATLLAGGGFVGYLFSTGHLSRARIETMARVLRGELDEPAPTAEAAPSVAAATPTAAAPRAGSEDEVRDIRRREHLERLETERAASDLEARRHLLDQVLQHVVQEQERLTAERKTTETVTQRKKTQETALEAGFQKELGLVSDLQPRQAKEHILRVWKKQPADAVRLLKEMDEGRVKRVFEQFKTPEELQIQSDLLEQIRLQGMEGPANVSGKTKGAAAP
jgi:hypothetical protein